jgi:7-carboxy-7-deazaguanine synthase
MKTYLSEIFSSVQGEGPYVGERHLFVRFCGCHRACIFCDTPVERTESVLVERKPGSGQFEAVANPLTVEQLVEIVRQLNDPEGIHRHISITGGAPLLQAPFLVELLPQLCGDGHKIYLETAGDLPAQLKMVIEYLDVVAMDVKLSSVTHQPNTFPAHWQFLKSCRDYHVEVFTKLIVSAETDESELMQAIQGIKRVGGKETLVILQPMTKAAKTDAVPNGAQLLRWQEMASRLVPNVRIIPQTHKMLEML